MLQNLSYSYDEFINEVVTQIPDYLPSDLKNINVERGNRVGNNNVNCKGVELSFHTRNGEKRHFLNLKVFYRHYEEGQKMEKILCRLSQVITETYFENGTITLLEEDYEKAKEYLMVGVCNEAANRKCLVKVPHEKRGDLALIFLLHIETEILQNFTIQITNSQLTKWGITEETLKKDAWKNMKKKYPPVIMRLEGGISLNALTNNEQFHAACYMFDEEYMSRIAEKINDDLVIIPSSIHEILFMKKQEAPEINYLFDMVRDVNRSNAILPEEVLSDNVYIYNRSTCSLCMMSATGMLG